MAYQFVIGIWEFHVNDLDEDLIRDVNEYLPTLTKEAIKLPQLRTIPVGQTVQADQKIMPYENAEDLVKTQEKFAVAPCICRREHGMVGKDCDRPLETCLIFGIAADYYLRNDLGRSIDQQEALNILKKSEEVGLVLQPGNSREIINICCCCSCCCQYLKALKRHPKPASLASTPFMAANNRDTCQGCETCIDRCQMEAISMEDGMAALDLDRCIGCGLCISTCPTESLTLIRKTKTEQRDVPKDYIKAAINLAQTRGKLNTGKLMKMAFKSKVDRILTPR